METTSKDKEFIDELERAEAIVKDSLTTAGLVAADVCDNEGIRDTAFALALTKMYGGHFVAAIGQCIGEMDMNSENAQKFCDTLSTGLSRHFPFQVVVTPLPPETPEPNAPGSNIVN